MRGAGLWIAVLVVILIVIVVAWIVTPGPGIAVDKTDPAPPSNVVRLTEPVAYCPPAVQALAPARLQVLLDSSASMAGVRLSMPGVIRWIEQAVSRMRGSVVAIESMHLARFDARVGILPSDGFAALAADYSPTGKTILHEAIAATGEYDLTFLVTDGVAASGGGAGDCAAGVDASCVARALRDAVHVPQTTAIAPRPGVWLIPLWVRHSGIFFTEKLTPTAEFDGAASLRNVHDELGQDISISNARTDREGTLVFDYIGPRGLLLIVIARSDDLGRRAVAALRERMPENDVAAVTSIRAATRPLSAFPPIELYPGYLPRIEWAKFEESDKQTSGTLDVTFGDRRIAMECAPGRVSEGEFTLEARRVRGSARCVEIYQLPAFEFEFIARNAKDQTSIGALLLKWTHSSQGDQERFDLTLRCGDGVERPCASEPLVVTWITQSRYDLSGDGTESRADALIRSITTSDLVMQPHRIYGLESLVSMFYDEVRQDLRRVPLADVELCHGRVGTPP